MFLLITTSQTGSALLWNFPQLGSGIREFIAESLERSPSLKEQMWFSLLTAWRNSSRVVSSCNTADIFSFFFSTWILGHSDSETETFSHCIINDKCPRSGGPCHSFASLSRDPSTLNGVRASPPYRGGEGRVQAGAPRSATSSCAEAAALGATGVRGENAKRAKTQVLLADHKHVGGEGWVGFVVSAERGFAKSNDPGMHIDSRSGRVGGKVEPGDNIGNVNNCWIGAFRPWKDPTVTVTDMCLASSKTGDICIYILLWLQKRETKGKRLKLSEMCLIHFKMTDVTWNLNSSLSATYMMWTFQCPWYHHVWWWFANWHKEKAAQVNQINIH